MGKTINKIIASNLSLLLVCSASLSAQTLPDIAALKKSIAMPRESIKTPSDNKVNFEPFKNEFSFEHLTPYGKKVFNILISSDEPSALETADLKAYLLSTKISDGEKMFFIYPIIDVVNEYYAKEIITALLDEKYSVMKEINGGHMYSSMFGLLDMASSGYDEYKANQKALKENKSACFSGATYDNNGPLGPRDVLAASVIQAYGEKYSASNSANEFLISINLKPVHRFVQTAALLGAAKAKYGFPRLKRVGADRMENLYFCSANLADEIPVGSVEYQIIKNDLADAYATVTLGRTADGCGVMSSSGKTILKKEIEQPKTWNAGTFFKECMSAKPLGVYLHILLAAQIYQGGADLVVMFKNWRAAKQAGTMFSKINNIGNGSGGPSGGVRAQSLSAKRTSLPAPRPARVSTPNLKPVPAQVSGYDVAPMPQNVPQKMPGTNTILNLRPAAAPKPLGADMPGVLTAPKPQPLAVPAPGASPKALNLASAPAALEETKRTVRPTPFKESEEVRQQRELNNLRNGLLSQYILENKLKYSLENQKEIDKLIAENSAKPKTGSKAEKAGAPEMSPRQVAELKISKEIDKVFDQVMQKERQFNDIKLDDLALENTISYEEADAALTDFLPLRAEVNALLRGMYGAGLADNLAVDNFLSEMDQYEAALDDVFARLGRAARGKRAGTFSPKTKIDPDFYMGAPETVPVVIYAPPSVKFPFPYRPAPTKPAEPQMTFNLTSAKPAVIEEKSLNLGQIKEALSKVEEEKKIIDLKRGRFDEKYTEPRKTYSPKKVKFPQEIKPMAEPLKIPSMENPDYPGNPDIGFFKNDSPEKRTEIYENAITQRTFGHLTPQFMFSIIEGAVPSTAEERDFAAAIIEKNKLENRLGEANISAEHEMSRGKPMSSYTKHTIEYATTPTEPFYVNHANIKKGKELLAQNKKLLQKEREVADEMKIELAARQTDFNAIKSTPEEIKSFSSKEDFQKAYAEVEKFEKDFYLIVQDKSGYAFAKESIKEVRAYKTQLKNAERALFPQDFPKPAQVKKPSAKPVRKPEITPSAAEAKPVQQPVIEKDVLEKKSEGIFDKIKNIFKRNTNEEDFPGGLGNIDKKKDPKYKAQGAARPLVIYGPKIERPQEISAQENKKAPLALLPAHEERGVPVTVTDGNKIFLNVGSEINEHSYKSFMPLLQNRPDPNKIYYVRTPKPDKPQEDFVHAIIYKNIIAEDAYGDNRVWKITETDASYKRAQGDFFVKLGPEEEVKATAEFHKYIKEQDAGPIKVFAVEPYPIEKFEKEFPQNLMYAIEDVVATEGSRNPLNIKFFHQSPVVTKDIGIYDSASLAALLSGRIKNVSGQKIKEKDFDALISFVKKMNKDSYYHHDLEGNVFLSYDKEGVLNVKIIDLEFGNPKPLNKALRPFNFKYDDKDVQKILDIKNKLKAKGIIE